MRGSDPDAALYYLCRMLDAGEDPLYLARRIVRMAVEDIGLADPQALVVANAAKDAYDFLGSPEGELAHRRGGDLSRHRAEIERDLRGVRRGDAHGEGGGLAAAAEAHSQRADPADEERRLRLGLRIRPRRARTHSPARTISRSNSAGSKFYDPPERGFEREIRKRLEYWAKLRKERGAP